jgi:hypothetical protein
MTTPSPLATERSGFGRSTGSVLLTTWPATPRADHVVSKTEPIKPGLAELAQYLTRSRFTTLSPEGARRLIELCGLERCDSRP